MNGVAPSGWVPILLRPRGEVKGILISGGGTARTSRLTGRDGGRYDNAPPRRGVFFIPGLSQLAFEGHQILEPLGLAVGREVLVDRGDGV
jgi:hypothetical protein